MWPYFDLNKRLEGLPAFSELSCLDLGCGAYESEVARQVLEIPWKSLVSVDGYEQNIDKAAAKQTLAKRWELQTADVRSVKNEADVVLSFDCLEHLTKEDGLAWLKHIETLAKKRIILFVPVEPDDFHRSVKDTYDPDNVLEEHLSHWKPHELRQLGYSVEEINDCHSERTPDGRRISFGAVWAIKNL